MVNNDILNGDGFDSYPNFTQQTKNNGGELGYYAIQAGAEMLNDMIERKTNEAETD